VRALAAALLLLVPAGAASAATSPWVTRANAVCRSWAPRERAAFAGITAPKTRQDAHRFLLVSRPLEAGLLRDLQAIALARPPGAVKALAAAATDLRELDAAEAAYGGATKTFATLFTRWVNDERATKAFDAIGAHDCS
jgi:hypothetical protein